MTALDYSRGDLVLVPFPFTDLSGRKRRPALVISPNGFHEEDLILSALTSRIPKQLSKWEVLLEAENTLEESLPKISVVKVGKLFTIHRSLVAGSFGTIKEEKLEEVLMALTDLFASRVRPDKGDGTTE